MDRTHCFVPLWGSFTYGSVGQNHLDLTRRLHYGIRKRCKHSITMKFNTCSGRNLSHVNWILLGNYLLALKELNYTSLYINRVLFTIHTMWIMDWFIMSSKWLLEFECMVTILVWLTSLYWHITIVHTHYELASIVVILSLAHYRFMVIGMMPHWPNKDNLFTRAVLVLSHLWHLVPHTLICM